jgi:hypothetical protein
MGYDHPSRIIRDLKDAGVTVFSSSVTVDGRRMARYTLVDTVSGDVAVRKPLPRDFRRDVYDAANGRCAACNAFFEFRYMQTDHRVPFAIGGDPDPLVADSFMTLWR